MKASLNGIRDKQLRIRQFPVTKGTREGSWEDSPIEQTAGAALSHNMLPIVSCSAGNAAAPHAPSREHPTLPSRSPAMANPHAMAHGRTLLSKTLIPKVLIHDMARPAG